MARQWDHPQDKDDDDGGGASGGGADGGDDNDGGDERGGVATTAPAALPGIASFLLRGSVVWQSKNQEVWI